MIRLSDEAPVKLALTEMEREIKKKRGGQIYTWYSQMCKQLKQEGLNIKEAKDMAMDRGAWAGFVAAKKHQYGL